MNDGLVDAFRHNAWATREVLRACRGLTPDQLDAAVTGTYGSIIATLRHIVRAEAAYCARQWYVGARCESVTQAISADATDDETVE